MFAYLWTQQFHLEKCIIKNMVVIFFHVCTFYWLVHVRYRDLILPNHVWELKERNGTMDSLSTHYISYSISSTYPPQFIPQNHTKILLEKMHDFQGKYVAQGTRDLLRFLDSKWSLQFNQQSLVSRLIIQCLFGFCSNAPKHIKRQASCLPPQLTPTLLLRKSWLAASSVLGSGVVLCIPTVLARTIWGLGLLHPEHGNRSCRQSLIPFQVLVCWALWIYTVPW